MAFFSKLFSRGNSGNYLALDIGTEVVKALIFAVGEDGKGKITGVGKVRQKLGNMQSGAVSDIGGVIMTARKAIEIAKEKSGVKKAVQAVVGIAGELVKGTTTTVHYERINPEIKIDLPELKAIIQKVQLKAYERINRQLAWETGQSGIDIRLINAAVVDVRIDGYRVTNPIGFQGRDVSISIFNAYAPMIHLGAIESIASELNINLLNVAAEPYAVARSVGVEDILDFSAIFVDIGGGTTDIAVVRNGGLEGTKMFALGGRAFTKRLSQEFKINFDEAEALKINYSRGAMGADVCGKIEKLLDEDCQIWLSGVELSLMEFAETDLLPSKILLCGGGSALPGIKKWLSSSDWREKLPFAKAPGINFLQPRDVANMEDLTGELKDPQDVTPMGLAKLALDFSGEEKMISGILQRTVHMMQD